MKEILNDYILPSGVLLTFIAAVANIYYTRINLKTSKYIDTITTERIKWLSVIRDEVTSVISLISESLIIHKRNIDNTQSQFPTQADMNDAMLKSHEHFFDSSNRDFLVIQDTIDFKEIIRRLNLLKLRLNPIEDVEILNLLTYFVNFYMSDYISENNIKEAKENINKLLYEAQLMLKNEWEKVKLESKGR